MYLSSQRSFTLVEVLIATVIVVIALCGIMATYVSCFELLYVSKNVSIATNAAQGLMEEIRGHRNPCSSSTIPFTQIANDYNCSDSETGYNDLNFIVNNMPTSRGVVSIDDTDPELLRITISVCWKQNNRLFGEDKNLNGVLDAGEDANGNSIIDSPVQLIALVVNR